MPASQCSPGQLQCCQSLMPANQSPASSILAVLGIVVVPATTPVGLNCSPIPAIGPGTLQCNTISLCCTANGWNGIVSIDCVAVDLNT
ncbi:hypothetical protein B0H34DRAFT_664655 [Crassisporium funariophilum]|nr:hypothetical protein B0H34DRAFT_664655 [Crassisporium funariophilum]